LSQDEAAGTSQLDIQLNDRTLDIYRRTLQDLRQTQENLMHQVLELGNLKVPLFDQSADFIDRLEGQLSQLSDDAAASGMPATLTMTIHDIRHEIRTHLLFRRASLQRRRASAAQIVDEIRQALVASQDKIDLALDLRSSWSSTVAPNLKSPNSASSINATSQHSPNLHQYLTQLGQVESLKEQLSDLHTERLQLLEEQQSRAHFGLSLDTDSLDFLSSFTDEYKILLDKLELEQRALHELEKGIEPSVISHMTYAAQDRRQASPSSSAGQRTLKSTISNTGVQREVMNEGRSSHAPDETDGSETNAPGMHSDSDADLKSDTGTAPSSVEGVDGCFRHDHFGRPVLATDLLTRPLAISSTHMERSTSALGSFGRRPLTPLLTMTPATTAQQIIDQALATVPPATVTQAKVPQQEQETSGSRPSTSPEDTSSTPIRPAHTSSFGLDTPTVPKISRHASIPGRDGVTSGWDFSRNSTVSL
jgi:hypothetical protein